MRGVRQMINYLLDLGLSQEELYDIKEELIEEIYTALELSRSVVKETLTYYKELGVNNLFNIIIKRPDLVLIKKEDVEASISKIDKNLFVNLVNNNIEDLMLFGI
jgi:hypothetical protein